MQLYIPHGSDESDYVVSGLLGSDPFISHMVQMKVYSSTPIRYKDLYFISHMVQMKV